MTTMQRASLRTRGNRITEVAVALVAMLCAPLFAAGADDWPIFLGEGRNSHSNESLALPWPEAGPPVLWTVELFDTYAAPTIAEGSVYVFDRQDGRALLHRLKEATGELIWTKSYPTEYEDQFDFGGGPRVAPLFDPGVTGANGASGTARIYVFGADGRLRCHNAVTGATIWEHDTERKFSVVQNFFGVGSSPVIYRDLLLVSVGGSPQGDWNNHEGRIEPNGTGLVAFDKFSGEVRYKTLDDLASYSSLVLAQLGGKERLVTFARSGLSILDPATGKVLASHPWRSKKIYSVNAATPVIKGDEIFVSESYTKGGLLLRWKNTAESSNANADSDSAEAGELEVVWQDNEVQRDQSLATHWNTPILHEGFLYGSHGEKSGNAELRCVEWSTGKVMWKQRGLRRANILYADGHLVVLGEYGELVVVEATPEEYREKQRLRLTEARDGKEVALLKHPSWNAPILANGVLYVAGADRLVALQIKK